MQESPIDVHNFDDIRPYNEEELQAAIARLLQEPMLMKMMRWVYPGLTKSEVKRIFMDVKNLKQFQEEVSAPAVKVITQMTTSGLSFSNIESIEHNKGYLFISNHRDIILDSAFLNVSLMERGYETTEIAIGDNLLKTQVVKDIVRSNKNFIVNRDVNAKEIFYYSLRLSNYIRDTITRRNTSIWIAHREGRSKDGDDKTSTGLLKMFTLSYDGTIEDGLRTLNLLPMCVSYEYDPCDLLKTNELLHKRIYGSYEKQPNEDFYSMITGITGHKGRVHIAVGRELTETYKLMETITNKNEKIRVLSEAINHQMYEIYKLWPTNYIAYDMLHGRKEFRDKYSRIQQITFSNYIRGQVIKLSLSRKKLGLPKENLNASAREILLQMYANPVINFLEVSSNKEASSVQ
ncbi:MAG TPA: 1-acyl-sn-glycerol-3-phosphate acyltransferase [Flavobacteriales bacterium]